MSQDKTIIGSNIYSYTITPRGYEVSQPNDKNKIIQDVPVDGISAENWKEEQERTKAAIAKVDSLNAALLSNARQIAKSRIKTLFSLAMDLPLVDRETNTSWDAKASSSYELIAAQIVAVNSNLPIILYDAFNVEHTFSNPTGGKLGELKLVPIISRISLCVANKQNKKRELYTKLHNIYNIDTLASFNPYEEFGLTKEQSILTEITKTHY